MLSETHERARHWALALVKGIREPHEVKKILLTSVGIEPTTSGLDLPLLYNGRSNPDVMGSIPTEVKRIFSLPRVVP